MRRILAIILGVVVGNAIFFLVSLVAGQLYPPDPDLVDPQTPEATAQRVDDADTNGLLLILLGGALGGLAAGVTGAGIERERPLLVATGVAGLLAVWGCYSFYVFYPARLWFPIGLLVLMPLSCYLGTLLTARWLGRSSPQG